MKHSDFLQASAEAECVQPFRKFQCYQFFRFCFLRHRRVYMLRWPSQLSLTRIPALMAVKQNVKSWSSWTSGPRN